MKRKAAGIVLGFLSAAVWVSGCAKTTEEQLIRQKTSPCPENYEAAEILEEKTQGDTEGEEDRQENGAEDDREDGQESYKEDRWEDGTENADTDAAAGPLYALLGAPVHYQSQVSDETGKICIFTDADVELPDVEAVSAITVSQHPFDQAEMDRITEAFFSGVPIYSSDSYWQKTKMDYQEQIEELEGYIAQGNPDPYGYGTDENGNYYYDIYQELEYARQAFEKAPETRKLVEVQPQYGLEADNGAGDTYVNNHSFFGNVVMPDGTEYSLKMKSYLSMPMEVVIQKIWEGWDGGYENGWMEYQSMKAEYDQVPEESEMEQLTGTSLEEARNIAEEKIRLLELENMELTSWEYGIRYESRDGVYARENLQDAGYMLHYTRKLDGIPITYTMTQGGSPETMDSDMETWGYEVLDFVVTGDGIDAVNFYNQYDIGGTDTEKLSLMPFDAIMEIYEKMLLIQNMEAMDYYDERIYRINRITFGYSRIYEPSTDSRSGVLVPVWDFFGSLESKGNFDGKKIDFLSAYQYESHLTINAVDGSIIDRELGY